MIVIKNKIPIKTRKWKSVLLFRIEKHNIDIFSNDELNTWDLRKLKEISYRINLYIDKQTFKRKLKTTKNIIISDEIIKIIESSDNQSMFNKLINDLPDNTRTLLGYFKKLQEKKPKIESKSGKIKPKKEEPKSV